MASPSSAPRTLLRTPLHALHQLAARHGELVILPSHCQASLDDYRRMQGT